jgi:hypothetical protein
MANSKANIYPIQLQGAELNLNKYDAEIKQYSGFNKNNSPFVGGCLANVFTKDETQEGSTSENTYIDTNGDVYHVDTEGLWKNGSKVLSIDSDNLYDIKQLDITFDVVNLFDEYAFVYKQFDYENNIFKYYFRFYDFYSDSWKEEFITSYDSISDIIFMCERIQYNTKYVWTVGYKTRDYIGYVCPAYNNFMLICSQKVGENVVYSKNSITDIYQNDATYIRYAIRFSIHTLYNDYNDKVYVAVFPSSMDGYPNPHDPNPNKFCFVYSAQIQTDGTIVFNLEKELTGNASGDESYYTFVGSDFNLSKLRVYDDTQHTFMYFMFNNKMYLEYYTNFQGVQQCSFKIVKDNTTGIKIEFSEPLMCDFSNDNLVNGQAYGDRYVFFNFGMLTRGRKSNAETPYSVCDYENNFVTAESETSYKFNVGAILDKIVLLNNETVTGLTLPKTQAILISDWNNVDENGIFTQIDGDYDYKENLLVIFKEQNSFFKVFKTSTPKLFLKENQIVINSDIIPNSYRISDGKTLLFAPSWNNRFKGVAGTDFSNEWYIVSSINEYKSEDNPSILINPIKVLGRPNVSLNFYKLLLDSYENLVNFYYGTTEPLYHFSAKDGNINNLCVLESIEGLYFPTNTDGNIQYSPSLFSKIFDSFGNKAFIKSDKTMYPLIIGNNTEPIMAFFLASGIDNLSEGFIVQGQFYGIINNGLYSLQYSNGVISSIDFVVDVSNLKFCGNTPYQAFFFSKTNRCLYLFTGANVMNQTQFLDKFEDILGYRYNPATQTIFMITENEVIAYSAFGAYEISFSNCVEIFLLQEGVCLLDDSGNFKYIRYYAESGYTKQNIRLETCFYGMNNQTVTINDCLYVRLFSEEHESGDVEMTASTLSNSGRMTEKTTFKIKSSDWDKMTHSIYLRYQPKEQRGLGVSFSINSPFKIAALSVGSQPDAILIDKVSKTAINAPQRTTNNSEW